MTREENVELIRLAKEGDADAMDRLTEGNMGLCKSIANFADKIYNL